MIGRTDKSLKPLMLLFGCGCDHSARIVLCSHRSSKQHPMQKGEMQDQMATWESTIPLRQKSLQARFQVYGIN
eukprot:4843397-Amphidinium_carterae.1